MNFAAAGIFAFMLAVNMFLFWGQSSVDALASGEGTTGSEFLDYKNTPIGQLDQDNYTLSDDMSDVLPSGSAAVEANEEGNFFTDTFLAIRDWFYSATGFKYLQGFVTAIPSFLQSLNLPAAIAYGLGAFYYGIATFALVAFLRG